MKVKVYKTIKNVNFIRDENNRPIFQNVNGTPSATLKKAWENKHFSITSEEGTFNGKNTMDATLTIPYTDFSEVRAINYIKLEVSGEVLYYFVEKVVIENETKATLSLYLDVITTYFDKLTFGGSSKIERKHFDRWKIDGDNIKPNFSEDSGIWNEDSELNNNTFIKEEVIPINVLDTDMMWNPRATAQKTYGGFFGYAIMNTTYGRTFIKYTDNPYVGLGLADLVFSGALVPLDIVVLSPNGEKIYEGANPISLIQQQESSFIQKIYALPLPMFEPMLSTKKFDGNERYGFHQNDPTEGGGGFLEIVDETKATFSVWQGDLFGTYNRTKNFTDIAEGDGEVTSTKYNFILDLSKRTLLKIADLKKEYDYTKESKLLSSKHTKIFINSVNHQTYQIVNEFVMGDSKIDIEISQAIFMDGGYQFVKVLNERYKKYNSDGTKIMVVSYKDQIPNESSAYNDYLKTNGNQYKTAIANNRINTGVGVGLGLIGSLASGNPIGALGSVMGFTKGINNERQMKAHVADLKNMGSTTEIQDTNIIKDLKISETFGDSKLAFSIETHPIIQQKEISNFYNKYGYEVDLLLSFDKYDDFLNRSLFSYWKAPKISKVIKKSIIGREILSAIDKLFNDGITFWSIDDNGEGNFNDYTKENWEKDIAKQITN